MAEIELPEVEELQEMRLDRFTRRVALTTAVFAVMLAITSLGGNNAMKEMLLAQQQASDQWAFYQAKVIREVLYRQMAMRLEVDILERENHPDPKLKAKLADLRHKAAAEEERYRQEKKAIEQEARRREQERDLQRSKDPYFDYAEVLLQIAIVMSSIAIIARSRGTFVFALVTAVLGTMLAINGFFLFVHLPFLN